jgi:hypothetical protein
MTINSTTSILNLLPQGNRVLLNPSNQNTQAPSSASPTTNTSNVLNGAFAQLTPIQIRVKNESPYIVDFIPTPAIAAKVREAGLANMFSPDWQALVQEAIERNGGMGNEEDGFLAWSKVGFVRLRNPNLTIEQNQKLATMSLEMGIEVENTPARADTSVQDNPKINNWVNEFIHKYESGLQQFLENPENGLTVKDGRRRYEMKLDTDSGAIFSSYYKKSGGLKGFFQRNMKYISPIADAITSVGKLIPGWGSIAAAVSQGVKYVGNMIANGKLQAKELLSTALSYVGNILPSASSLLGGDIAQNTINNGIFGNIVGKASNIGNRLLDAGGQFLDGIHQGVRGIGFNLAESGSNILNGIKNIETGNIWDGIKEIGLGGLKAFVQTPIDAGIMIGGRTILAGSTLLNLNPVSQSLTTEQKETIEHMFGNSLDTSLVRVQEGPEWLFKINGDRAFVLGNTIYTSPFTQFENNDLIHEAAHVWQNQNGGTDYISESLFAQLRSSFSKEGFSGAYKFDRALLDNISWENLNPEQQAHLIEAAYIANLNNNPTANNTRILSNGVENWVYSSDKAELETLISAGFHDITNQVYNGLLEAKQAQGAS